MHILEIVVLWFDVWKHEFANFFDFTNQILSSEGRFCRTQKDFG